MNKELQIISSQPAVKRLGIRLVENSETIGQVMWRQNNEYKVIPLHIYEL